MIEYEKSKTIKVISGGQAGADQGGLAAAYDLQIETGGTAPYKYNTKWGYVVADPDTGKTSREGVWAGGDIVTGSATVILAMGAGRIAADSIHKYLETGS